jgi:hypothetical protein
MNVNAEYACLALTGIAVHLQLFIDPALVSHVVSLEQAVCGHRCYGYTTTQIYNYLGFFASWG